MKCSVARGVFGFTFFLVIVLSPHTGLVLAQEVVENHPELRKIWDRLEQLEQQNEELQSQNSRLEQMLENRNVSYNIESDEDTQGPIAIDDEFTEPLNDCCSKCYPHCDCWSCICPQQPAPCIECPHVSMLQPYWNLNIFGAFVTDMLYNTQRPFAPGTPFFLFPEAGLDTQTFDMHARQSQFGAVLTGPEICGLQSGGVALFTLYNDAITVDRYGVLPLLAYGELKNDRMRFAAGLQFDVFSPNAPNVLPFAILGGSGNAGNSFRGQARLERFFYPTNCTQWTLQCALSEPIATGVSQQVLIEDNGWPNIEGRIVYGKGHPELVGLDVRRPFEIGLSGVVGQVRSIDPVLGRVVNDVWGTSLDFRWKINEHFGLQGELHHGQGLGTYNAAILQTVNLETLQVIRTSGGWIEGWCYWTPCVHTHIGYAVDDPRDRDLALTPPVFTPKYNETWFANCLWDVTPSFRIGVEFTWRETRYINANDAEGAGAHTQFRWSF